MSTSHTPGPWFVSASGPNVYALHGSPPRNRFSAHVQAGRRDDASAEELAVNARLIAAAPDLLEALETALTVIKVQRDLIDRNKHDAAWNPVIEVMSAAIAKATGQS